MNPKSELTIGNVKIVWLGHASFMLFGGKKIIYIDPHAIQENPEKADMVFVTHDHFDHCDAEVIEKLKKQHTEIIGSSGAVKKLGYGKKIDVDQTIDIDGVVVRAVHAYNPTKKFHPRGVGVGFVITIDGVKIYHAGDTDKIPEMAELAGKTDAALLPIGGTYTMNAQDAAEAALIIKPKFLVPMHYNSSRYGVDGVNANPIEIAKNLAGKGIAVRILEPLC